MVIVLGVSGGIAAYKSVFIVRLLVEAGHEVHVVPTEDSLHFVGKATWEAISRQPVTTSVHENVTEVRHVRLGQEADLIIVAPATAQTLASMAAGLADNLLGTTLLASTAPVLVAPAMHTEMWQHPATVANVETLRSRGVHFVGPDSGRLTGADTGPGRMSEPQDIVEAALALGGPQDLADVHVLVSAGGTREPIDPVRFLGNRSSGRQGVAVALAAAERGATVDLVAANIESAILDTVARHQRVTVHTVGSTHELQNELTRLARTADLVVMAAAVADYRVADVVDQKITKEGSDGPPSLSLVENPDVLRSLTRERRNGQLFVAFAAETANPDVSQEDAETELLGRARRKRARKDADFIALNTVGWTEGFESEQNTLTVIGPDDEVAAQRSGSKRETADALFDAVVASLA